VEHLLFTPIMMIFRHDPSNASILSIAITCTLTLLLFDGSTGFQYLSSPTNYIHQRCITARFGWLENFFEPQKSSSSTYSREVQYPEQYPATYELNDVQLEEDESLAEAKLIRPLLKNTQLQSRPLQLVYDAERDGWNPTAFHCGADGKGAAVVLATTVDGLVCGGYNPKGFASLGGARPSVAAFLFYQKECGTFQKLQKVGGGGLACARDDPNFGISFGPDALVIGLQPRRERIAQSKLGPYYEKGPQELPSLFGGVTELLQLKVLVGRYEEGEEIPYSGGVLDMTSG
jgi:hypothetical protein